MWRLSKDFVLSEETTMKTIPQRRSLAYTAWVFTLLLLPGCGGGGTVALGTRGNLIGAPTTKAVQTAAQLNAKIATLPALQSLKCPSTHGSIC